MLSSNPHENYNVVSSVKDIQFNQNLITPSSNNSSQDSNLIDQKDEKIRNLESQLLKLSNEKSDLYNSFQLEKTNLEMKIKDLELKLQTEALKKNYTDSNDNQYKYLFDQEKETTRQLRESLNAERAKIKEMSFDYEQKLLNCNKELQQAENEKKEYIKMYEEMVNRYKQIEHQYNELNSRYLQNDKELQETKSKLDKIIEEQAKSQSQTLANLNALELMKQQLLREKAELSRKLSLTSSDSEKRSAALLHDFKLVEQKYNEQVVYIERLQKEKAMLLQSLKNEVERNSILTTKLAKLKLQNEEENEDLINESSDIQEEKENKIEETNNSETINIVESDTPLEQSKDDVSEVNGSLAKKEGEYNDDNTSSSANENVAEKLSEDDSQTIEDNEISNQKSNSENNHSIMNNVLINEQEIKDTLMVQSVQLNDDTSFNIHDTQQENVNNNWISSLPLVGKLMGRKTPQQSPNQLKHKATNY